MKWRSDLSFSILMAIFLCYSISFWILKVRVLIFWSSDALLIKIKNLLKTELLSSRRLGNLSYMRLIREIRWLNLSRSIEEWGTTKIIALIDWEA